MHQAKVYTIITGAGSGLGKAFAVECAKANRHLILIALPGSRLYILAEQLNKAYNVTVRYFEFDMADIQQLQKNIQFIKENFLIDALINNAGMGGTSTILGTSMEVMDKTIQLNMRSTAFMSRAFIPSLLKHSNSYIINIASMAAFTPIAFKTVYPATKAFVTSFSLGLREELCGTNINVSVACPGPIMTNANTSQRILFQGLKARLGLLSTNGIAKLVLTQAFNKKAVIVPGTWNSINQKLMRFLPLQFKTKIVSSQVRKEFAFNI